MLKKEPWDRWRWCALDVCVCVINVLPISTSFCLVASEIRFETPIVELTLVWPFIWRKAIEGTHLY